MPSPSHDSLKAWEAKSALLLINIGLCTSYVIRAGESPSEGTDAMSMVAMKLMMTVDAINVANSLPLKMFFGPSDDLSISGMISPAP